MKKNYPLVILLILGITANIFASTIVYIDPAEINNRTLMLGDTFSIRINVQDVIHLYSWGIRLYFNPNILIPINAVEGDFLPSAGSTFPTMCLYYRLGCVF